MRAAMQFSNLITYDALYYKNTDAAAYYEAYGDIVGGIGSYPVLGNPHYHQPHDLLEGINHQLVAEVAKTTAATVMLLASSPSRLKDFHVDSFKGGTASLSWTPVPKRESPATSWRMVPPPGPKRSRFASIKPSVTLTGIPPGTIGGGEGRERERARGMGLGANRRPMMTTPSDRTQRSIES